MFIYESVTVVTVPVSAAYTMQETDTVIVVNQGTGAAITINLVATPITGKSIIVKDGKGDANTHTITIDPAGATTVDGQTTTTITTAYGHVRLIFNGTEWGAA